MKKGMVFVIATLLLVLGSAQSDALITDWSFTLTPPGGTVGGPPGSTVEWGYSITNLNGTHPLYLTSLSADLFQHGDPLDIFDYPVVSPGATQTGPLYQLTWYSTAPVGFSNSGKFILGADWYDNGSWVDTGGEATADYKAVVTPIPGTLLLLGSGLVGLVGFGRKRRKSSGRLTTP